METASLTLDLPRCTACMACELACSFTKEGVFARAVARINVVQVYEMGVNVPIVCVNCQAAPCIPSCPSEAIVREAALGNVHIVAELCSACGECVEACPYGAVHIPAGKEQALMCDLCDGQPACVGSCLYGALRYEGRPDVTFTSLDPVPTDSDLPSKRWLVATDLAGKLAAAWEVRP